MAARVLAFLALMVGGSIAVGELGVALVRAVGWL